VTIGPLAAVRVCTRDLAASRAFYADSLGLVQTSAGDEWVAFDAGRGVQLVVEVADTAEPDADEIAPGRFTGLSFAVEDAARACEELEGLDVRIIGRPERQPWGGTLAHIADPDGNVLTLVQAP
jgi:catechol 2,3-dioxygenase-like lactoylglutathione lyase family enzyme